MSGSILLIIAGVRTMMYFILGGIVLLAVLGIIFHDVKVRIRINFIRED